MQLLQKRRTPAERRGGNNGGFPEPPEGDPVRVAICAHPACGAETEICLPAILSERIIQRVVCNGCQETYEPALPGGAYGPGDGHNVAPAAPPAAVTAAVFGAHVGSTDPTEAAPATSQSPGNLDEYAAPGGTAPAREISDVLEPEAEPEPVATDQSRTAGMPAPLTAIAARVSPALDAGRDRLAGATGWGRERFTALAGGSGSGGVRGRLPRIALPDLPRSRLWAWASVPLALLGVVVGLSLIQGDSSAPPADRGDATAGGGSSETRFISQPGYSLALPAGWKKTNPPEGAVFAAEARDGSADATLWIEEDASLTLKRFEKRSVAQLEEIAENVRVADRVSAPTIEGSIIELRADTPIAEGVTAPYRVTLRGAGPFRHYLATAQQPGADPDIAADIELMHNSLRPEVGVKGLGSGGQ